jgi:hypothetical protein
VNISSTDDVCDGNRRPLNSQHTEDCHIQSYSYMCHVTHNADCSLPTTVPAVLADSMLQSFIPRVKRDRLHVQQYVSMSVQRCDDSNQLLQGEKQH